MATLSQIRRLAFQALFQIDARGAADMDVVRDLLEDGELELEFSESELERAFDLAVAAYEARAAADAEMLELAPTWPASRQAAVDRAILRIAHYEMVKAIVHPKVAVNEAVELAKEFSTDKSPAFINGLLDKVLKRVLAERGEQVPEGDAAGDAGRDVVDGGSDDVAGDATREPPSPDTERGS